MPIGLISGCGGFGVHRHGLAYILQLNRDSWTRKSSQMVKVGTGCGAAAAALEETEYALLVRRDTLLLHELLGGCHLTDRWHD